MNEPILSKIEAAMAEHIEGMSVGDGYYSDWGSVNEPDISKQEFPSAEILVESEACLDEKEGVWSQVYEQEANFLIRVRVALDNEVETPLYEINAELNKALEDLKRLFGRNYTVSDSCETIMYRGMQRLVDKGNDIFRPAYLETRWLVRYTQDRQEPSSFSN